MFHRAPTHITRSVIGKEARLLWRTAVLVALLAGCDAPAYDLSLRIYVFDPGDLEFRVDQQPMSTQATVSGVRVDIERHYESYESARGAPPVTFEAFTSGELAWTQDVDPAVCGYLEGQCGDIVAASLSVCFDASGNPGALCEELYCSDSHGLCGAVVASPNVEPLSSN